MVGFLEPMRFYALLRQRKHVLGLAAASHLLIRPSLWVRVYSSYRRASGLASDSSYGPEVAELASIGVRPEHTGHGVGKLLLEQFIAEARRMGVLRVHLTTDAQNNDYVNRFYQKAGFRVLRTFEKEPGRQMHEYVLTINQTGGLT